MLAVTAIDSVLVVLNLTKALIIVGFLGLCLAAVGKALWIVFRSVIKV